MRLVKSYETRQGNRRVIVDLDSDDNILFIKGGQHVKLGYPHGDIVAAHVITEMKPVAWCSASQEWQEV